jgi:hypothetical protein
MLKLYQQIVSPCNPNVKEGKNHYRHVTERHLQIIWLEQKFLKNLVTSQGESIEIISPGIWNTEAGPDFLKTHLRIGQRDYRGDVEIHLHEGGWYHHGHHCDPRYNGVILHLSYSRSSGHLLRKKENGQQVYSCHLEESLNISTSDLFSLVDCDVYPSKVFSNSGRCAEQSLWDGAAF